MHSRIVPPSVYASEKVWFYSNCQIAEEVDSREDVCIKERKNQYMPYPIATAHGIHILARPLRVDRHLHFPRCAI